MLIYLSYLEQFFPRQIYDKKTLLVDRPAVYKLILSSLHIEVIGYSTAKELVKRARSFGTPSALATLGPDAFIADGDSTLRILTMRTPHAGTFIIADI